MNNKKIGILISIFIFVLVVGGIYKYTNTNAYLLKKGNEEFERGNYKRALEKFYRIENIDKDNDILIKKIKCEINLHNYKDALNLLDILEKNNINSNNRLIKATLYYDKIICLHSLADFEGVINISKSYFEYEDNEILALSIKAYVIDSYLWLEKFNECINFINDFLAKHNNLERFEGQRADMNNILFSCYQRVKDYDNALKINDLLISLQPENLEFYIGRSVLYSEIYDNEYAYKYLVSLREKFNNNERLEVFINSYKGKKKVELPSNDF